MTRNSVINVYDDDGNRVAETVGGTTTQYLVDTVNPTGYAQVIDELVGTTVTRTYAYGLQRISENQQISGAWTPSFYGYDGHGNVRYLMNSAGGVTDTYTYDAFGLPLTSTGTTPNTFLYSGEQFDSTLGLYYLRARYYNPATGRFLTMDPYWGSVLEPPTLHKYVYTKNNPVNAVDPSGRDAFIESLFTTTDIRTPLEVNAEIAARSVAEVVCSAAKFLANVLGNWPPGAPSPIGVPLWPIKGASALCTALGL